MNNRAVCAMNSTVTADFYANRWAEVVVKNVAKQDLTPKSAQPQRTPGRLAHRPPGPGPQARGRRHKLLESFNSSLAPLFKNSALALVLLVLANTASSATLCEPDEVALFNCTAKHKTVSLCRSSDLSVSVGYMQYRYGHPGHPEMVFPKTKEHPSRYFSASYVPGRSYYSSVSFKVGKIEYEVYSLVALPSAIDPNNDGSGDECGDIRHGVWVTNARGQYDVRCNCDDVTVDGLNKFFSQSNEFGVSTK